MLIKALMVFVILLLLTLFAIWFERRVVGRMQHRPGPNWNGPFGLLQSLADALKLHFKEGIIPAKADKVVYILAPAFAAIPAFLIFSIIPVGGEVEHVRRADRAAADRPARRRAGRAGAGLRSACTGSCSAAGRPDPPIRCSAASGRPRR